MSGPVRFRDLPWRRLFRVAWAWVLGLVALVLVPEFVRATPFELFWVYVTWRQLGALLIAGLLVVLPQTRQALGALARWTGARLLAPAGRWAGRYRVARAAGRLARGLARAVVQAPTDTRDARLDRAADWLLSRMLPQAFGLACVVLLLGWVPHYLTWPWWPDLDQFAITAQSWDAGIMPYRDMPDFDFPGPIYMFWMLGKLAGWGKTVPIYVVDALFLMALGWLLVRWSRRRFQSALPGLAGYTLFVCYYLSLDYTLVAQRDWHAPFFAVAAVLATEAWPGRATRVVSGALMALALVYRPQVVLLLPAVLSGVDEGARQDDESRWRTVRAFAEWSAAFGLALVLAFAPLVITGVADDFFHVLNDTRYGSHYNKATPWSFSTALRLELLPGYRFWVLVLVVLVSLLGPVSMRRICRTWALAFIGVLLYKPISPVQHKYLYHPLTLVWLVSLGLLAGCVLRAPGLSTRARLLVLVICAFWIPVNLPRYWDPVRSLRVLGPLMAGEDPRLAPLGCEHVMGSRRDMPSHYRWSDYRDVLAYLRRQTSPQTRVANVLRVLPYPTLNGPAGRLTSFPAAGGILYLGEIDPAQEPEFAEALEQAEDAVVVWVPSEAHVDPKFEFPRIISAISRTYRYEARFGQMEIWRKRPAFGMARGAPAR